MLLRMYLRWTERRGLQGRGGRPAARATRRGSSRSRIEITGEYAYGYLKGETGVHRLVRISPFDASKRRHTSFASVAVMPEVEDVEVDGPRRRAPRGRLPLVGPGRPGRQHRRLRGAHHAPADGIVVSCQNERSQLRNRDTAMRSSGPGSTRSPRRSSRTELDAADRGQEGDRVRQPDPHVRVRTRTS